MISIACTIGMPDFIMVANCRLKKAMSLGWIGLPALPNSGLGLGLTTMGVMPKRRSSARSKFTFLDCCSPFILTPRLSLPSQTKVTSFRANIGASSFARTAIFDLAVSRLPRHMA